MNTSRLIGVLEAVRGGGRGQVTSAVVALMLVLAFNAWSVAEETASDSASPSASAPSAESPANVVDEPVLRYLPDECRLFCQVTVAPIMKSEYVRNLSYAGVDPAQMLDLSLAQFGLKLEDIDRVYFGARTVSEDAIGQYVAIVFCNRSLEPPTLNRPFGAVI